MRISRLFGVEKPKYINRSMDAITAIRNLQNSIPEQLMDDKMRRRIGTVVGIMTCIDDVLYHYYQGGDKQ